MFSNSIHIAMHDHDEYACTHICPNKPTKSRLKYVFRNFSISSKTFYDREKRRSKGRKGNEYIRIWYRGYAYDGGMAQWCTIRVKGFSRLDIHRLGLVNYSFLLSITRRFHCKSAKRCKKWREGNGRSFWNESQGRESSWRFWSIIYK